MRGERDMSDQQESLEQQDRRIVSEIMAEHRPVPAPSPGAPQGAGGHMVEVHVPPAGGVVLRVGTPEHLQAVSQGTVSQGDPCINTVGCYDRGCFEQCYDVGLLCRLA